MKWLYALLLSLLSVTAQAQVESFYEAQQNLIRYYQSGTYMKEFSAVTEQAMATLKKAVANRKSGEKIAIVLDVDETALSNIQLIFAAYSLVYKVGDSVPLSFFEPFQSPYHAPALWPVLQLYRYALAHNVAIFFVSARRGEGLLLTEKNLQEVGFTAWNEVMLLGPSDTEITSEAFKTRCRGEIVKKGYTIVLTLGDQNSDVNGPNTGKAFRLPNPFYYTP